MKNIIWGITPKIDKKHESGQIGAKQSTKLARFNNQPSDKNNDECNPAAESTQSQFTHTLPPFPERIPKEKIKNPETPSQKTRYKIIQQRS